MVGLKLKGGLTTKINQAQINRGCGWRWVSPIFLDFTNNVPSFNRDVFDKATWNCGGRRRMVHSRDIIVWGTVSTPNTHFHWPSRTDGTEQELRTSRKTLVINGPSLVQAIPMGGINDAQMGCSWHTCLLTTNTASSNTAQPKHGRLIRIPFCRCRYKLDVNRDATWKHVPLVSLETARSGPHATKHCPRIQVRCRTLVPLPVGRVDQRISPTSILCLDIPVTLGQASVTIEEQTFPSALALCTAFIPCFLHPCRIKHPILSWWLSLGWNTPTLPANFDASLGYKDIYNPSESRWMETEITYISKYIFTALAEDVVKA